jgi:hypothetical protein
MPRLSWSLSNREHRSLVSIISSIVLMASKISLGKTLILIIFFPISWKMKSYLQNMGLRVN